jgi:MFS transporter, OFA family, oxalate/formate antiporter
MQKKQQFKSADLKNVPFSPSGWPFFYGWIIIFAGIAGILMSIPGQTIGVSLFTDHLIGALDMGRVNLALAYMAGTILSGFCIPWAGRMYDKYGVRPVVITAGILMGMTLVYLSRIVEISSFFSSLTGGATQWWLFSYLLPPAFFRSGFLGRECLQWHPAIWL